MLRRPRTVLLGSALAALSLALVSCNLNPQPEDPGFGDNLSFSPDLGAPPSAASAGASGAAGAGGDGPTLGDDMSAGAGGNGNLAAGQAGGVAASPEANADGAGALGEVADAGDAGPDAGKF